MFLWLNDNVTEVVSVLQDAPGKGLSIYQPAQLWVAINYSPDDVFPWNIGEIYHWILTAGTLHTLSAEKINIKPTNIYGQLSRMSSSMGNMKHQLEREQ